MPRFLVITLAAPLASFGDLAGHERRGGRDRPARSALLGMLGAGLGLRRDDTDAQSALAEGYGIAVRPSRSGTILQDFHTTQTIPSAKNFFPQTRAEALQADNVQTMLSVREYRTDVLHDVAFWQREGARWSLEDLAKALCEPHFVLYFGRKSCPLSQPMDPRLIDAEDVVEAFAKADKAGKNSEILQVSLRQVEASWSRKSARRIIAGDLDAPLPRGNRPLRQERRWDQPRDRGKWHFASRQETIFTLEEDES